MAIGYTALEIKGMEQLQKKMEQVVRDINGTPMLNAMRDTTLSVFRDVKKYAPVDTGAGKASITPQVFKQSKLTSFFNLSGPSAPGIVGVVGSNIDYMAYQEFGTGTVSQIPGRPAHWPRISSPSLQSWATRRGLSPKYVAWVIGTRGGLNPQRFFQRGLEDNLPRIRANFMQAIIVITGK